MASDNEKCYGKNKSFLKVQRIIEEQAISDMPVKEFLSKKVIFKETHMMRNTESQVVCLNNVLEIKKLHLKILKQ